jgi:PBSX family phage portal protein
VSTTPDPAKVRAAIAAQKPGADGRVLKVLYLDDKGESVGDWASTQLPENPWDGITAKTLIEPPFPLPQLVFLAEMHPVHSSALEQKTADVTGKGWVWEAENPDRADKNLRDDMESWFQSLAPDEIDMRELVATVWNDVETTGWGLAECARDPQGIIKRLYHVPAHTVKCHKNGYALCQARDSRKVWFRRWGATDDAGNRVDVNMSNGAINNVPEDKKANDLFVIKKPSRRSTWYGIPGYISAIGGITLALAARDDNLYFFANRREPRWAIILTGMSEDTEIEEDLRRAFTVDLKQPYRNLMIPVAGKDAKVDFQKLSETAKDGSFSNLSDRADRHIMIAHRVPAERLANSTVGALGGNIAQEANRVYKEGVVEPSQEILNARLRRFVAIEYAKFKNEEPKPGTKNEWLIAMSTLDTRSEREDLDQAVIAFHGDLTTLREARHKIGYGPLMQPKKVAQYDENGQPVLDPVTGQPVMAVPSEGTPIYDESGKPVEPEDVESEHNEKLFTELPGASGQGGSPGATPPGAGGLLPRTSKSRGEDLERYVRELLRSSREVYTALVEKADADD